VYEKAFHGRSIATLSATGNPKVQAGFGPLVEGFIRVPVNDIEALKKATEGNPNVVAVFFETIQGEGGINPMRVDYLQQVRKLCDERDWLLMIDEVQCGMGRTGKWFAHQWAGIQPDVMPLAKGLGSGVPIGAVVAGPKAAHIFQPGNHGTTFGGNPLAMRAGVETIRIMEEDGLLENAAKVGAHLKAALSANLVGWQGVTDIRGQGLMLGVELAKPCGVLVNARRRSRPADQRHGRQRDPPGAATDPDLGRSRRAGGYPCAAGQGSFWQRKHEPIQSLPAVQRPHCQTNTPGCSSAQRPSRRSSRPTRSTTRWPTARWP
jgi:acetylornithine/succinyldiaminopimelate/putrescine aminotransferase